MLCQGASCSSFWADEGLSRGTGGRREWRGRGSDKRSPGREIEMGDERGEIKRGMAKEKFKEECRQSRKEKIKGSEGASEVVEG